MNPRNLVSRYLAPLGFFAVLLTWIGAKVAYSFTDEFPRLSLLCKWDCGWYESIARQGYRSPVPPLFQNSELSNVAFFPAYPLLGRTLSFVLGIPIPFALPLVSILCSVLISVALFRLLRAESRLSRLSRYALLVAYPASFYLFVSYSEALYLSAMLGGAAILLRDSRKGFDTPLLAVAGFALGATRLTGFVIPSFLFAASALQALRTRRIAELGSDPLVLRSATFLGGAIAGTSAFFVFCALKFGAWNLYFQQLALGWYKEFSPIKALGILFTHPFPPTLDYETLLARSRSLSWMVIATILAVSVYAGARALLEANLFRRALVFGAIAHLFIVVCGDVGPWDAWGNGIRYAMPTVFLLAIAWNDEWTPRLVRERAVARWIAIGLSTIVLLYLFALEVGYLGRFIRNEWVS